MGFIRRMDIQYKSFYIEKKQFDNSLGAIGRISKQLSIFIREHLQFFFKFDTVKVYYDNGQIEVTKMLASVFGALLPQVEFKKVLPVDYKLFQVADLICTMRLITLKLEHKGLSKSEIEFFGNHKNLKKNYLQRIESKKWE